MILSVAIIIRIRTKFFFQNQRRLKNFNLNLILTCKISTKNLPNKSPIKLFYCASFWPFSFIMKLKY